MNIFRIRTRRVVRFGAIFVVVFFILFYTLNNAKPDGDNKNQHIPRQDRLPDGKFGEGKDAFGDRESFDKNNFGREFHVVRVLTFLHVYMFKTI